MEYLMRHPHQFYLASKSNRHWGEGTEPESNAVTTLVYGDSGSAFRQLELKIGWRQSTVWVTA